MGFRIEQKEKKKTLIKSGAKTYKLGMKLNTGDTKLQAQIKRRKNELRKQ